MKHTTDHIISGCDISPEDLAFILTAKDQDGERYLFDRARMTTQSIYGNQIYIRGLIEITNHCKNDCLYCGIRRSRADIARYRLTKEQILACCRQGHTLGFRTFVLQGGEDAWFNDDRTCDIVATIHRQFPDCAITLSLGERTKESYRRLFAAGADRYLLRHETANRQHYAQLHPSDMSFDNRMRCLGDLKEIGYQVGCGFMVGSPHQTLETLYEDLQFIRTFRPEMVGIGPFIPATNTPFADCPGGTVETTLRLLALIRILHPHVLLPSTTALSTLHPQGHEMGILAGANVIMPNLSPAEERGNYCIYDNKRAFGTEAAETIDAIRKRLATLGLTIAPHRGDYKK